MSESLAEQLQDLNRQLRERAAAGDWQSAGALAQRQRGLLERLLAETTQPDQLRALILTVQATNDDLARDAAAARTATAAELQQLRGQPKAAQAYANHTQ